MGIFHQLLTFALENFREQAMYVKISYDWIYFRTVNFCQFSTHLNISITQKLPDIMLIIISDNRSLAILSCITVTHFYKNKFDFNNIRGRKQLCYHICHQLTNLVLYPWTHTHVESATMHKSMVIPNNDGKVLINSGLMIAA